ncbi:hypothetical protein [Rhizorhabdus wittichii]|uniref:hypothetical protein n=1 Tax=Rhizorhabdus wittichii TaxID=160791 RepID=UPI0012FD0238|nr:hypothetical protein [Rhizorhabdus wittichii]
MTRYVTRAAPSGPTRSNDDWWDRGPLLPTVSVDDRREIDTGLIDHFGNAIMRVQPPIGFGRDGEW